MRVDLTDVPDTKVADEVVLPGTQGTETITLDELTECRGIDSPASARRTSSVNCPFASLTEICIALHSK